MNMPALAADLDVTVCHNLALSSMPLAALWIVIACTACGFWGIHGKIEKYVCMYVCINVCKCKRGVLLVCSMMVTSVIVGYDRRRSRSRSRLCMHYSA